MKKSNLLKKGGIDTILAYIVVSIPLFYVLIFMIATLYHFSVQMHINQTLKETLIMASSYGQLTEGMLDYLFENISNVGDDDMTWNLRIGVRGIDNDGNITPITIYPNNSGDFYTGISSGSVGINLSMFDNPTNLNKGDLLSVELVSNKPSLLGKLSRFSVFGSPSDDSDLYYSSYREEIIANVNPNDV